ncbi:MAG: 5-formyltetrahydrofolate cyclo-ligase [Leucobacter sp.]|nr:5-formyltetrahydrofolate cyclo-ligase [Leucobacter sp.]
MVEHDEVSATVAAKQALRTQVRAARRGMTPESAAAASAGLTARLVDLVSGRAARSVAAYFPVRNEPDTRDFLAWARDRGVEVLLPVSRADGLMDWVADTGQAYAEGAFGIPEPTGERRSPLAVAGVDLMLIPACAVDRRGMRLGWGRGYYDRCLSALPSPPPVFALIHEAEFLDEVPSEPHDTPVAGIVTPERTLEFGR